MKAKRNKTIDLTVEEGQAYLARCVTLAEDEKPELARILNRTILGDTVDVMQRLPRGFADLMIADPPYNMAKTFQEQRFRPMPDAEYEAYTQRWLTAALPLLKENASVYVCCDWRSGSVIERVLAKHLHIQNRITWQREKGRGARTNWKNAMEDIWFATKSADYKFHADAVMLRRRVMAPYKQNGAPKDWEQTGEGNFRNTYPSNFWDDISVPFWSMPENTAHPTQKPEKLLAKLILASSDEGDVVLDPFLGSGSTSAAAKKLNRCYVGIEQEPRYCVWAEKRLELAEKERTIQGYADGIFWERNTSAREKKEYQST